MQNDAKTVTVTQPSSHSNFMSQSRVEGNMLLTGMSGLWARANRRVQSMDAKVQERRSTTEGTRNPLYRLDAYEQLQLQSHDEVKSSKLVRSNSPLSLPPAIHSSPPIHNPAAHMELQVAANSSCVCACSDDSSPEPPPSRATSREPQPMVLYTWGPSTQPSTVN